MFDIFNTKKRKLQQQEQKEKAKQIENKKKMLGIGYDGESS